MCKNPHHKTKLEFRTTQKQKTEEKQSKIDKIQCFIGFPLSQVSFNENHSILCTRSLKIPLYKAILFAGIPRVFVVSLLQLLCTLFRFLCFSLFATSLFSLTSFTLSSKLTFFLFFFVFIFLSLFFSSEKKKIHIQYSKNYELSVRLIIFYDLAQLTI